MRTTNAPALGVAVVALAGMAYCHIEDVGMKFDEHVYYMAALFCANIAASVLLIPALLVFGGRGDRRAAAVWGAAGALAAMTIAGFVWSRTIGFPQMQDHVGAWDELGLASLVFESLLVLASLRALVGAPVVGTARPRRTAGGLL
jgi:hypothetical protein